MKHQGFLYELFQISAVKWLCELKSFISFKLTFTVLPGYLNFSITDVTTNVADITLCELLLSIEDKSAILYCSWSQHGLYMKYHLHLSMLDLCILSQQPSAGPYGPFLENTCIPEPFLKS